MRRFVVFALAPLLLLAAAGAALAQGTPTPAPPSVFVRQDPALGPYLTDPAGMTLYLFTRDTTPGESTCYDDCAEAWPPFSAEEPLALAEGVPGELSTVARTDGTTQVAYNGIPLYYWQGDQQPGDVTGHGVGDVWFVVAPGAEFGAAAATPPAVPAASPVASPAAGGDVEVTLSEFAVSSSVTTFAVGETYTFNAANAGEFTHELVIEAAGAIDEPLEANGEEAEIEEIASGESASLTWTFTDPGAFQLACHLRQHYQRGMVVTIRVVEEGASG